MITFYFPDAVSAKTSTGNQKQTLTGNSAVLKARGNNFRRKAYLFALVLSFSCFYNQVSAQVYTNFTSTYKDNTCGVNDWITGVTINGPAALSFSGGITSANLPVSGADLGIFSNAGTPAATGTAPYVVTGGSGMQGQTYTITISKTANATYDAYAFAYVDYNGNGSFTDAGEQIMGTGNTSTTGVHIFGAGITTATATFTVPITAAPGTYRLRTVIVCGNTTCGGAYNGPSSNCTGWGNAKDFNFTVLAANPCSGTQAAKITANAQSGDTVTLSVKNVTGNKYKWSTGAKTRIITVGAPGDYDVTVTSAGGCSSIATALILPCAGTSGTLAPNNNERTEDGKQSGNELSTQAQTSDFQLSVFPNPYNGFFHLKIEGASSENISVKIYDVDGKLIEERNNISYTPNITFGAGYNPGFYIAKVQQGGITRQSQVIKIE